MKCNDSTREFLLILPFETIQKMLNFTNFYVRGGVPRKSLVNIRYTKFIVETGIPCLISKGVFLDDPSFVFSSCVHEVFSFYLQSKNVP